MDAADEWLHSKLLELLKRLIIEKEHFQLQQFDELTGQLATCQRPC